MENPTPSVFHAYDIRGLSPQELDANFATRLARALVTMFKPHRVLVGLDMRTTSPDLEDALVRELIAAGVGVKRIGLCSTPMFNVSVGLEDRKVDFGVMVTASHNPGKYNGFKIVRGDVSPVGQGSGMEELSATFLADAPVEHVALPGSLEDDEEGEIDALPKYIDHILSLAKLPSSMPKMKVVIDAGNGMAGAVLPELLQRLPWLEAVELYFQPDGSFPNHEANPLKRETLKDLSAAVVRESAVLGVAFDGDADRIGFVDETGTPIPGDLMTAIIARELLAAGEKGEVLYDVRSSWSVPETIAAAGGTSKMCRVGHAFIKSQMKKEGSLFAGEVSMHYYFRDLFCVESGDLVMLLILRQLAEKKIRSSELWKSIATYSHSGEINFEVADKAAAIERVRSYYSKLPTEGALPCAPTISEIDGLRFEFRDAAHPENDWWFNVRLSNTEPLVRLNLETRTPERTAQKVEELSSLIKS